MTYGREWQLGYDKLPPLPWWLAEAVYRVFGTDDALYALCQVLVIIAFVAVWKTARPLVGATGALAAILIIDGMHYFTASATKLNHNVVELPLWALAGFAFLRRAAARAPARLGFARGGARARLVGQIFCGDPGGAAGAVSAARPGRAPPVGRAGPVDRGRRGARRDGAASDLAGAERFPAVRLRRGARGAAARAARSPPQSARIFGRTGVLSYSVAVDRRAVVLAGSEAGRRAHSVDAFDRRIVTLLAFGPALTLVAFSLVTGRGTNAMWGFPLWLFLGLWIVLFAPAALDRMRLAWIGVLWAAGIRDLCRCLRRRLPGAAAFRSPLPGRVLSRRSSLRCDHATVRASDRA